MIVPAITAAQKVGLTIWLGTMVGSRLNSDATAHLMPLASNGDLDGSLLVCSQWQLFVNEWLIFPHLC
jgi:hypothetical protein